MTRVRGKKRIDYGHEVAILKTSGQWVVIAVVLAAMVALPSLLKISQNTEWLIFINTTFITVIAVLGLNVITGMAGQVSLGHTAFVMVGAFTTGVLLKTYGWPFWLALPASAAIAAVLGLVVGAPSLRLKGFYLAVGTLAFLLIAQFVVRKVNLLGGLSGIIGVPAPALGTLKINNDTSWYYLNLVFVIVFIVFSVNLARSRLGRAFLAVRDSDTTAASLGIEPYGTKLRAFFIGALFAGVAGSLLACYVTVVRSDQSPFTIWDSIWYLGMIVIGGAGSTSGAVLGVIFLRLIGQVLHTMSMASWADAIGNNVWVYGSSGLFGLAIVLFVSFRPYGLISVWERIRMNYKRWPFGY